MAANKKAVLNIDDLRHFLHFANIKYDIICLDIGQPDFYSSGIYTLEFYNLLKKRLDPDGVMMILGLGLSRRTLWDSIPFIYRNVNPDVLFFIRETTVYLRMKEFPEEFASEFKQLDLSRDPTFAHSRLYSDEWVWRSPPPGDLAKWWRFDQ